MEAPLNKKSAPTMVELLLSQQQRQHKSRVGSARSYAAVVPKRYTGRPYIAQRHSAARVSQKSKNMFLNLRRR